jgi:hypothetical protein
MEVEGTVGNQPLRSMVPSSMPPLQSTTRAPGNAGEQVVQDTEIVAGRGAAHEQCRLRADEVL